MNDPKTSPQGAGAAVADAAPTHSPTRPDTDINAPHARPSKPLAEDEKPDQLADKAAAESRQEALVDEGVEETFPASDPVSVKRIT